MGGCLLDNLSICITLKNRAKLLDAKLHQLQYQDYDLNKVEICITDGYSTDNIIEVIEKWQDKFYQIKYAISDRSVLPFVVPTNNPACDINAQICNVATFEKIIRTDAEVAFAHTGALKEINQYLNEKDVCVWYRCSILPHGVEYNFKESIVDNPVFEYQGAYGGLCFCFNKSDFIINGGIEEKFAIGFGWEDTYFREWWSRNKKLIMIDDPSKFVWHFWHGYEKDGEFNMKLWREYSEPLFHEMVRVNTRPNEGNSNWTRPEMIKNERIFKCQTI